MLNPSNCMIIREMKFVDTEYGYNDILDNNNH